MSGLFKKMKTLREAAESVGVEVTDVCFSNRQHLRVTLRKGTVVRTSFAPASPSDHRALLNWKSDIRRMFAG